MQIHCAPLQGYTDHAYRRILHQLAGGVDVFYTPFIRWEKGEVRSKDEVDILPKNNEGVHLIPQIICSTPDEMKRLSDMVESHGYSEIDINMGCPAPMQTKLQRGSGILPHPDRIQALCREIEQRPELRCSVKMRLGLDRNDEWQQVLPILNQTPLQHITLHPRIGKQMYKGEVDMQQFSLFCDQCRHPLVFNGDLRTLADINRLTHSFPHLQGIMLGRGLLARPTLAREFADGEEWNDAKRMQVLCAMHQEMLQFVTTKYKVESQILLHIHAFWEFQEEMLGRKIWKKIMKAGNLKNYLDAVRQLLHSFEN
ncbi:MAG: tRNA-dihydrouridine synthase family protein [Bacteroidales bacterium]|nr:tRNA-dihydrouridine synthase family protein [Candidatus Physcousia equi]